MTIARARLIMHPTSAFEALAALPGQSLRSSEAARTTLTEGLERLSAGQIQQRLAAQGIEISADFAAELQVEAVQKLENRKAAVKANDEQATTTVDTNDGADVHGASVEQPGDAP